MTGDTDLTHPHATAAPPRKRGRKTSTTTQFIERARAVHGDRYNYDWAIYTHSLTPIQIGCPEHGVFTPTPNNHINSRSGCPQCGRLRQSKRSANTVTTAGVPA